jgi:hypothetical protein
MAGERRKGSEVELPEKNEAEPLLTLLYLIQRLIVASLTLTVSEV